MKLRLTAFLIFVGLIVLSDVLVSCRDSAEADENPNVLTEAKLNALMVPVKRWEDWSYKDYSSNDWAHLISAAKVIQKCDPKSVEKALRQYQLQGHPEKDFYNIEDDADSKLFLLMRVIFQLPTSVPERDLIVGGGWLPSPGFFNKDHTLNQSWPIGWDGGRPSTMSAFEGMQGIDARYNASWEYSALLRRYPMRDLSPFKESALAK